MPYNYSGNNIVKVNVGFNYKLWYNLVGDSAGGMNFGSNKLSNTEPTRTQEPAATLDRSPILTPRAIDEAARNRNFGVAEEKRKTIFSYNRRR